MLCPHCQSSTRVLETRREEDGAALRRRRECAGCGSRFTTYERREAPSLFVRKRDGRRQRFDRAKLHDGMTRAAYKRPVERREIEAIVDRIEAEVEAAGGELEAKRIGELCLAGLREVDRISYLQFAAVYRQLADVEDVQAELARLGADPIAREWGGDGLQGVASGDRVPSDSSASMASPRERDTRAGRSHENFGRRQHGAH